MRRNRLLLVSVCAALLASSPVLAQEDEADGSAEAAATTAPAEEAAPAAAAEVSAAAEAPPVATQATAAASVAADASAQSDASYDLQMYQLEDELNELKEDVFSSKARLRMLWHQLMQERIGGARIEIEHVNALGRLFEVQRIVYSLNGSQVFFGDAGEDPSLATAERRDVYSSPAVPGPYTVVARVALQGRSAGVFSYMRGYEFEATRAESFFVEDGTTARVGARLEDGGNSLPFEERPRLRFVIGFTATGADAAPVVEGGES